MERGGEGYFTQANKDSSHIGPSLHCAILPTICLVFVEDCGRQLEWVVLDV